jgi:hypothetical protein
MEIRPEVVEVILVEHARRDEDPPGPQDLPLRHLRRAERHHARIGLGVPGGGIEAAQLSTNPPQLGLGP